ncbi:ABC transporter permease [Chloroflexota bacterium]
MTELTGLLVSLFSVAFWAATVRFATPLIFAAIGEIFSERGGVLNIGLEGMMLAGAFGGVLGAHLSGSPWIGLVTAMLCGGLVGLIHAFVCVTIGGNQVVSGVAINIAVLGLTTFFSRMFFEVGQRTTVNGFEVWAIPYLSDIPIVGEVLFQHVPLVYIAYILVPVSAFVLYRTTWGLRIRAVGEQPLAADTVGVDVRVWRYGLTILCGALAAVGGAFLSLGQLNIFLESMTAGRGFIALAAVIFGRWDPWRVAAACVFFGAADASTLRLQALDVKIPYELVLMIPYLLTFLAFVGLAGRTRPPAALGLPYNKGRR